MHELAQQTPRDDNMQQDITQNKVRTCAPTATIFAARLAATATPAMASGDVLLTDDLSNATPGMLACVGEEVVA